MSLPSSRALLTAAAAAVVLGVGAGAVAVSADTGGPDDGATTVDVAAVQYPVPSTDQAPPPARLQDVPGAVPGAVVLSDGPFSDRVRLDGAALSTTGSAVTGALVVTSDVSELLELTVTAWFYDAGGALVGTGQQVLDAEPHSDAEHGAEHGVATRVEGEPVVLDVRAPAGVRAASAVLSVPVLVNE